MKCQKCARLFSDGEPSYRISAHSGVRWGDGHYGAVGLVCADCMAIITTINTGPRPLRDPKPCRMCQRPVFHDLRRREPKYIVCSPECRSAVYDEYRASVRAARRPPRPCEHCGTMFIPAKAHAKFCSAACKQRAYRLRLSSAPAVDFAAR
jgi:hypothetical protein